METNQPNTHPYIVEKITFHFTPPHKCPVAMKNDVPHPIYNVESP
jgi:hypothetical protein